MKHLNRQLQRYGGVFNEEQLHVVAPTKQQGLWLAWSYLHIELTTTVVSFVSVNFTMAGWLRGTVKEVVSGDTVVVCGAVKSGPPPEKRLTLSSVIAPKLAKRDGSTKDEPFAWASREFLRQKIIGQQVVFKTDYVVEQIGNREFGSIFLEKENVACSLVAAGLAKVRASGTQQSPYIESLRKAEEHAQLAGLGLWTKDADALANSVRSVPFDGSFSASAFLQAAGGKGTVITGVVEAVANGGMLRITTLPDYQQAIVVSECRVSYDHCTGMCECNRSQVSHASTLRQAVPVALCGELCQGMLLMMQVLCGVQAPSMGRKVAPATASESEATPSPAMPSAASIAGSSNAEPFAREAKQLTEARALNREVRLVLEGVDKYENLFATVYVPPMPTPAGTANGASAGPEGSHVNGSNGAAHSQDSLAELLVKVGYAKCVEWSLGLMTSGSNRLRDLEKAAKAERRGMWTNWVPPVTNQNKLSDTFHGKVVEVVSGDCLVIKDMTSGVERRVQLSSLRAPRMGTRERGPDPWATDAKEFLRKKLIGREVDVKMEYTRKVPITGPDAGPGNEERLLSFGNVELAADSKGGEEAQNVAEMVVARGFANVIKHRMDEERSSVYEKLVECEELAKNAKRGVFSAKEPAANRMNDVSAPGNAQKQVPSSSQCST
ncbi:ribonuclease [Haematococcus lacustris]|uniref:Ribonuclease n=1 Tax=Haematococcus lacustris TaxID=44745 RepID=A0A699ZBX2_HAELA|nr:ribonuclease [Haematococcus lacustris]